MLNPLVSCVCPTYRRPRLAELAVQLFLAQTWQHSELIVIDDSPEGERPSIRPNARVKYVRLKDRITMGEKHNMGHALAQGDVLAYWDDDDFFGSRRLLAQLDPIALGQAEMTGMARDLVAKVPSGEFYRFLPDWFKSPRNRGNTMTNFTLPWHDGTAMFVRRALKLAKHPNINQNNKVQFINSVVAAGLKWKRVENDGHFVYVRHEGAKLAPNTWQFNETSVLKHVPAPWWFPAHVLEAWKGVA